jgi:ABC-type transporter lipoprotein component MlaA
MDKPEDAAGIIITKLVSREDIEKEHDSAVRRQWENIREAEARGYQRALEALNIAESALMSAKAALEYSDSPNTYGFVVDALKRIREVRMRDSATSESEDSPWKK